MFAKEEERLAAAMSAAAAEEAEGAAGLEDTAGVLRVRAHIIDLFRSR